MRRILAPAPSAVLLLALGAPGENGGNGYFAIVYGSAGGLGQTAGSALAMGNIDGVGADELVVGMPAGNVVYVFPDPWGPGSTSIAGFGSGDGKLGYAVAVGDFDNDGNGDIAMGAPAHNPGVVFVVHGGESGIAGTFRKWHQGLRAVADTAEPRDRFGAALAIRDFDGNGFGDLAVGVPGETVNDRIPRAPRIGMAQVFPGTAAGLAGPGGRWHQNRAGILGTGKGGDGFGSSLAQ